MSQQSDEVVVRDRSRRLFTFLKELSQLRSRSVRSWRDYPNVIWLGTLPASLKHKSLISSDPDADFNPLDPIAQIPESEFVPSSDAGDTQNTELDSQDECSLEPEVAAIQAALSTAEDRVSTDPILS